MDLIIRDVPDVDSVKAEIINNAMTTISNYLKSQIPKSKEQEDADIVITSIRDKNKITIQTKERNEDEGI